MMNPPEATQSKPDAQQSASPCYSERLKHRRTETNKQRLMYVQIVTALQRGAKSRLELALATGGSRNVIDGFIAILHDQGAVYVSDVRQDGAHRPTEVFSIQRAPFEFPDVERGL